MKFPLETIVYRKTDPEVAGMVTGIVFRPTGHLYLVAFAGDEQSAYEIELTTDRAYQIGQADDQDEAAQA